MKVLVIGLGSMGKRRIRLMKELYPSIEVFGTDGKEDRREETQELFGIRCFSSIDSVDESIDCAFICTSPLSHSGIITECLERGWNVFTELNLVDDGYDKNLLLAKEKGLTLFLSSTFFYREETRFIRSKITADKQWNYIYHIGQYLPDWHPWENYKDFFIGDKRTNGCREIMAIELPWLTGAFGEIKNVQSVSNKMTNLAINFDDNYFILIEHENGNRGVLIVDVVSPVAVRKLDAYAENAYLTWGGTPESVFEFDQETGTLNNVVLTEEAEHKEGYRAFIVENAYKNEIMEFFDVVQNGKKPLYGFEQDKKILQIIDSMGA